MNKTIKRIAIFAAYDADGIVHDYVCTYIRHLSEVAQHIIVVYDNYLSESEKTKISPLVDCIIADRHTEYDFGSYKRGYKYAIDSGLLANADELIFANDSCLCLGSFVPAFEKMKEKCCDFYGATENVQFEVHLQSYFLVFRKQVFNHFEFKNFIFSICKQQSYMNIVMNYEIGLTRLLKNLSFKYMSVCGRFTTKNPCFFPSAIYKNGMPLLKKKYLTGSALYMFRELFFLSHFLAENIEVCRDIEDIFGNSKQCLRRLYSKKICSLFYEKCVEKERGVMKIKIFRIQIFKKKI